MATREQLAILDSARGWTAVPMTSTGCYDTNHLFYAFHGVYTVTCHTSCVSINSIYEVKALSCLLLTAIAMILVGSACV